MSNEKMLSFASMECVEDAARRHPEVVEWVKEQFKNKDFINLKEMALAFKDMDVIALALTIECAKHSGVGRQVWKIDGKEYGEWKDIPKGSNIFSDDIVSGFYKASILEKNNE